ncbi:hypothetical protein FQN54_001371 [Arachnomyces sp. PD_36]|nr:hypothetical protein FQN54_001371 [Arachnomyces sp. PD_36]
MSGAEALAVVGIIANFAQVVDATVTVVKRVANFCNDVNELPKVLKDIELRLPLLAVTLQKRSDEEVLKALSETERKALANVLSHLQSKAQELKTLLDTVFPAENASAWEKGWKAAKSFRQEKKAQAILNEIESYFQYLELNDFHPVKPASDTLPLPSAKEPWKPLFVVNIRREGDLIGREDVMERITDSLSHEDKHNRIAIVALGGLGKTRVALEYAMRYKNSDKISVFWIHASSKARISEAYGKIAEKVKIPGYEHAQDKGLELVKDWFESESSGKWLMVIDNADDIDLLYGSERLADYFPRSDNGSCIMTTRNKQVGFKFANTSMVLLETLDLDRSQELLSSKLLDEFDPKQCADLAQELEGIPLALVQAAAFITMNSIDIEEYLELYRESPSSQVSLLSEDFEDSVRDRETKNPVAATWSISFEYIERHAPLAGELLKMMCILDYQSIPLSLLQADNSQHGVVKALGTLQAFCLIHPGNSKGKNRKYDMHRLVHISMRNWLALHDQLSVWTARTLKLFAAKFPNVEDTGHEEVDVCAVYLPHALFVLASNELGGANEDEIPPVFQQQKMIGEHAEDDVICACCAATLMIDLSISYDLFDNNKEFLVWSSKAYTLRRFVYGEQHSETVSSLFYVAAAYYHLGQQEKAMGLGMKALGYIESGGYPPSLVAKGHEIRASIYSESDMLQEAEESFKKMVEIRRDFFGSQQPQTLKAIIDLAMFYSEQERCKEAEKLVDEVLNVRMATSYRKHPSNIVCLETLCNTYYHSERYDEAVQVIEELYAIHQEIFGPNHSHTLINRVDMVILHEKQGRYDDALQQLAELLERSIKFRGPEDPVTLQLMAKLSDSYEEKGLGDKAENLRTQVLDAHVRMSVPQSPAVARELRALSSLYEGQGRYKEAEPLRERVVQTEKARVGEDSREVILSLCELGINYSYQGLHEKASEYQYDSLQLPFEFPDFKRSTFITRMLSIADGWVENGNISDGEKMARDAVRAARQYLEPTYIPTISALTKLADVCVENYSFEEAEKLYREALDKRSRFAKPNVAQNMTKLAQVLRRRGSLGEAETLALEAKDILSTIQNPNNSKLTVNMSTLADIYQRQGRYSEAESLYSSVLTLLIQERKPEQSSRYSFSDFLAPLQDLASLYRQVERYTKAENILSKTLSIRRKIKGPRPTHIDTLFTVAWLGDTYNSLERFTEALALLSEFDGLVSQEPARNDNRSRVAVAHLHHSIAKSHIGLGQYDDAEKFVRLAGGTYKEILGEKDVFTLHSETLFGPIYRGKGMAEEEVNVETHMLSAWTKLLGDKDLNTIRAMQALAKTYTQLDQTDEARELDERAAKLSEDLDFGLNGEEEKKVDELVATVFRLRDENEDMIRASET